MGPIIGHRIDYNGVGVLRDQRHIPSKNWPKYPGLCRTCLSLLNGMVPKCIYLCCRNKINFIANTSICGDNWHDGNKNSSRTIEAQIVQKLVKNNEPCPKFTGSYKKKRVVTKRNICSPRTLPAETSYVFTQNVFVETFIRDFCS